MFDYRRTHNCGDLNINQIGEDVVLSGWVHRRRDLGSLVFIDLRDRFGLTQIVFDPQTHPHLEEIVHKLRLEWVISIKGKVSPRAQGMSNPKLSTGEIEVRIEQIQVLSNAKTPPFLIEDQSDVNEELRLKYRYLDLRSRRLSRNMVIRHQVMMIVRKYMDQNGFLEITTPILAKSTPEGARDYLVPSRVYPGNFFALPQSPQIFKQLLMMGGMDRYFQIATCFRDEDLRADRQPEFTQIDIEMSFSYPEDLMSLVETLIKTIFVSVWGINDDFHFPRLPYKECIEKYGTDRPDLRFEMPLIRLDDLFTDTTFETFAQVLQNKGCIKALCIKNAEGISRKEIEKLTAFVNQFGLKGLSWFRKNHEGWSSNLLKFVTPSLLEDIGKRMNALDGDLILVAADTDGKVNQALDHLRRHVAKQQNLLDPNKLSFLWVTEFPMFKFNEEENKLESEHHPFTSPHFEDLHLMKTEPLKMRAQAYDLVLNGYEIGGGSQRIHQGDLQKAIFETLSLTQDEIQEKFGFFVDALNFGTPPHLGLALGLDRLIMILTKTENIRDVIAFPKTQKASDLMLEAPSEVKVQQLQELEIASKSQKITWR
ncbi:MAG: aspartate--tRNA ligase [Rhabdochlamydiaceae bacterium]